MQKMDIYFKVLFLLNGGDSKRNFLFLSKIFKSFSFFRLSCFSLKLFLFDKEKKKETVMRLEKSIFAQIIESKKKKGALLI